MIDFKTALKLILTVFMTAMIAACATQKPQTQVQLKTTEKVVEKLIPYALPADSTYVKALFECDSLNQVQLKELEEQKAKGMQSDLQFDNGRLHYKLKQPPDTVFIQGTDRFIYQDIPVEVIREVIEYRQTDIQIVLCWLGKIFIAIIGIGLIIGVLKWKRLF